MSGAQTSSFYPVNQLLVDNAQQIQNTYAPQRNELFVQRARQEIGAHDTEEAGRIAATLLVNYNTPEERASAYPSLISQAQANGRLRNAPPVYPGDQRAKAIWDMATSAEKQAEMYHNRGEAKRALGILSGVTPEAPTGPGAAVPTAPTTTDGTTAATPAPAASGVLPPTPQLAPVVAPGGAKFSVAAPHAERFQALVNDLEAAGYKINPDQSGGYNRRFIAGTQTPSNHAHGAAIDINWTANARGGAGDIPPELARSLAAKHGLVWGGDWTGATRDPMHFEVPGQQAVATPGAGGGVAARTGGTDVAGPPGVVPGSPPAPFRSTLPPLLPSGLDAKQEAFIRERLAGRNPNTNQILDDVQKMQTANLTARRQEQTDQRLLRAEERTASHQDRVERRLTAKDEREASQPVPGSGHQAAIDNTLLKIGPKIRNGTATEPEREQYELHYQQYADGPAEFVTDPKDPTKMMLVRIPRTVSPRFPPPDFTPGGQPAAAQPGGVVPVAGASKPAPGAAEAEAKIVATEKEAAAAVSAIDNFLNVFREVGGGSIASVLDNPTSVPAQKLLGAATAVKTALRSDVFLKTGVLQPGEDVMLEKLLTSPREIRSVFATDEALTAKFGQFRKGITDYAKFARDPEARRKALEAPQPSVGGEVRSVQTLDEAQALPPGTRYRAPDGKVRIR